MKHNDARIYNGKTNFEWKDLKLNSDGLLPVIVQDYVDSSVLMYTYMNEEAWNKTLTSGLLTYYCTAKGKVSVKGERSGNFQYIRELFLNFENSAVLVKVYAVGPTCSESEKSCFFRAIEEI